jgi:hypothetical protein
MKKTITLLSLIIFTLTTFGQNDQMRISNQTKIPISYDVVTELGPMYGPPCGPVTQYSSTIIIMPGQSYTLNYSGATLNLIPVSTSPSPAVSGYQLYISKASFYEASTGAGTLFSGILCGGSTNQSQSFIPSLGPPVIVDVLNLGNFPTVLIHH